MDEENPFPLAAVASGPVGMKPSNQTPPRSSCGTTLHSPPILRAPKLQAFPVPEVLAGLFIDHLPEGSSSEDIKKAMSDAVDSVLQTNRQ